MGQGKVSWVCGAVLVLFAAGCGMAEAQMPILVDSDHKVTSTKVPDFDVVSVKPNKSEKPEMRWQTTADGFSTTNLPLVTLIGMAYGIRQDLISGQPGWVNSTGFDVSAKVAGEDVETLKKLNGDQRRAMLKPLLAERFSLKVHEETRTLPVYELEVAKGGPKMKQSAPEALGPDGKPDPKAGGYISIAPGRIEAKDFAMETFVNNLAYAVERTVIDKTGMTGKYDLDLKWTPEHQAGGDNGTSDAPSSIFTAVQEQLGLRLQSTKGPVKTLVVDHAALPTEN